MNALTFTARGSEAAAASKSNIGPGLRRFRPGLTWADKWGLSISAITFACVSALCTLLLLGVGRLDDPRLNAMILRWLVDAQLFFAAPLWAMLRIIAFVSGRLRHVRA